MLHRAGAVHPLVREGTAAELGDDVVVGLHHEGAERALGRSPRDHLGKDELALAGPVAVLAAVVAPAILRRAGRWVRRGRLDRGRGIGRRVGRRQAHGRVVSSGVPGGATHPWATASWAAVGTAATGAPRAGLAATFVKAPKSCCTLPAKSCSTLAAPVVVGCAAKGARPPRASSSGACTAPTSVATCNDLGFLHGGVPSVSAPASASSETWEEGCDASVVGLLGHDSLFSRGDVRRGVGGVGGIGRGGVELGERGRGGNHGVGRGCVD